MYINKQQTKHFELFSEYPGHTIPASPGTAFPNDDRVKNTQVHEYASERVCELCFWSGTIIISNRSYELHFGLCGACCLLGDGILGDS